MSFRQQRINRPQLALRRARQKNSLGEPMNYSRTGDSTALAAQPEIHIRGLEQVSEGPSTAGRWAMLIIVLTSLVWIGGFAVGFQTALAINMIIGLVLAVVGLRSPSLGLLAIGMLAAIDAIATGYILTGGLLRFNTVNYWLLVVMALYFPFLLRLNDVNSRALQIFLLLIGLQIIYSTDISKGIQDILNVITTFGMVVYFARAMKDRLALYWLGVVLGVLAGLGGLVFFLQINQLPYANPNNWTYFQLTALFAICISFHYARILNKGKLILLTLALINFAWIFLSGSRGSLLIALLCIVYLFLATRSITWSSMMIAVAILIGMWVSTSFAEQQIYTITRIQMLFDDNLTESRRTSQRSILARAGFEIFMRNPLGIGTGSFRHEVADTAYMQSNRPAHSAWIKTLAENGVPGTLLLAFFIGSFALAGFQKRSEGLLLFGFFISITLASAFVAKEFQGKSLWFLAASGIAILHSQQLLELLERKLKKFDIDNRQRLREIRYGRKTR
jgi:hypothetical protein